MTEGIIIQGLTAIKDKGTIYTIKMVLAYIGRSITHLYREYSSYCLSIFLGPELTRRIYFAVFKFRCKYHLFIREGRALWLGKKLRDYIYKITYVNPAEINYEVKGGYVPYIQDGDWDLDKSEFSIHETIKGLFVDNIPASETKQYKIMKEAIENKDWNTSRDCRTQEDLDVYFRTFEDIYRDFSNGIHRKEDEVTPAYPDKRPKLYSNEVLLSIDREGQYMLESGGTHRLSIAKLVGLKKIPVIIIRKHYQYVKSKKDWVNDSVS